MSKIDCEVIKDLLPIYIDDIASKKTREIVEEHIEECEKCKTELNILRSNMDKDISMPDAFDDAKIIRSFRRSIRKKQLIMVCIAVVIAVVVSLGGAKLYHDATRPDINGNEMIASTSLTTDGEPEDVCQVKSNGIQISKNQRKVYISLPVNNKHMESCHIKLFKEKVEVDDVVIPISDAGYVTYCLDGLENMESGLYKLEIYDSKNEINQYKWFELN